MEINSYSYLQALLTSLDGSDVTGNTTTDDNEIVVPCCPESRKISNRIREVEEDLRCIYRIGLGEDIPDSAA